MKKTIGERAKEAIRNHYACNGEYPCSSFDYCKFGNGENTAYNCEECGADEFENGYHIGCKDQRKIDIDKACEVYSKELKEIIETFNNLGKRLYGVDELGELISLDGCVKDFRKAMEE